MKITNGVDIVEIKRFENVTKKFLENVFTDKELKYIESKNQAPETIAGLYAAKEATLKSLGIALNVIALKDIEINHDNGNPYIKFNNKKELNYQFSLSISHDGLYAIAFVICY